MLERRGKATVYCCFVLFFVLLFCCCFSSSFVFDICIQGAYLSVHNCCAPCALRIAFGLGKEGTVGLWPGKESKNVDYIIIHVPRKISFFLLGVALVWKSPFVGTRRSACVTSFIPPVVLGHVATLRLIEYRVCCILVCPYNGV